MAPVSTGQIGRWVVGDKRPRRALVGAVLGLLGLASGAFFLGLDVGLFDVGGGWIVVVLGIAFLGGIFRAGLGSTVGSLWLIAIWWFVFPPLVGYFTGEWTTMASRYMHPRVLGFGYTSARTELLGGLEYGVRFGLLFAVISGTIAYILGTVINGVKTRLV
ncbi:hypothetical protein [Saliphagus infecundisoli]|uniref:DUF2062 domain-containing protein n=1 Tax=Saliphagus infecundisoli TaxID=1849069 RepID=A0ABD5QK16_9EURY|nr:hypothetical protein [Saliphagus infecundisoli]